MPIPEIEQPDFIQVNETVRLRKYDGRHDFAFEWYQDPETVLMVDGVETPYTRETLDRMYAYLDSHGELYFIELMVDGTYIPIGDVAFWQEDMPIVIGNKACRGQGIGRQVIQALIQRGQELGYHTLYVSDIYDYNTASKKCFESLGFRRISDTEKGSRYRLG